MSASAILFPRANGSVALSSVIGMLSRYVRKKLHDVVAILKAIHAQEDKVAVRQKAALVAERL